VNRSSKAQFQAGLLKFEHILSEYCDVKRLLLSSMGNWASRLLPHAGLWLAMFEAPAYKGMTFSLSHKRLRCNPINLEKINDKYK